MTSMRRDRFMTAVMVVLGTSFMATASIEGQARGTAMGTRADLEIELASLQEQALATGDRKIRERMRLEIDAIAMRLRDGDIYPGDIIALSVAGETAWTADFTVTTGRRIELETLPPISLANVLYSELEAHLTTELGKYLREPRVRAVAQKRIAVLGAVGQPGFMAAPGSIVVADLIMLAGGPSSNAELDKAEFKRLGDTLGFDTGPIAFQAYSLDQLGIRSGDELHIPQASTKSFWQDFRFIMLGITGGIVALTRIF